MFYSGEGALDVARAAKGAGRLLEDTIGGKLLNIIDKHYPVPQTLWDGASRLFSMNAKGDAQVFLREPELWKTWNAVERPTIELINRIHAAVTGNPAIGMLPR